MIWEVEEEWEKEVQEERGEEEIRARERNVGELITRPPVGSQLQLSALHCGTSDTAHIQTYIFMLRGHRSPSLSLSTARPVPHS